MDIQIYVKGRHFEQTSDIKSLLAILKNYEGTYSQCLKIASEKFEIIPAQLQARIKLRAVKPGSLDIRTVTEIGAAVAPLAPQIFNYAWLLYKSGYDLIGLATKHFRTNGEPMQINIENSNIAGPVIVVSGGGNVCQTSFDVLTAASGIQKGLKGYAEMIDRGQADDISISNPNNDRIVFDKHNEKDYKGYSKQYIEDELVELKCNIIRLNKKTLHGTLEIYDGEESISKPFVASSGILDDCLDAFKAPIVNIMANKEIEINALGETTIIRYHAVQVRVQR